MRELLTESPAGVGVKFSESRDGTYITIRALLEIRVSRFGGLTDLNEVIAAGVNVGKYRDDLTQFLSGTEVSWNTPMNYTAVTIQPGDMLEVSKMIFVKNRTPEQLRELLANSRFTSR